MPEVVIPTIEGARRQTRVYDNPITTDAFISALSQLLPPAGTIVSTLRSTEPDGDAWKLCDGQSLVKEEYPTLYGIFGGTFGETTTTFNLPDLRGRIMRGADSSFSLGASGGQDAVTLTVQQIPSHNHTITDAGHTHTFTGSPHNHTVTDAGHIHTVTDAGHDHTVTDPGHTHTAAVTGTDIGDAGTGFEDADSGNTGSATTGVTVDSATTGVAIDSATTGITVDNETAGGSNSTEQTGITLADTGGGQPVDITPPIVAVNWLVRT